MSQFVTTNDGVTHEFPDDATPQQMRKALTKAGHKGWQQAAHGLAGSLPMAGMMAGGLIGGAGGTAAAPGPGTAGGALLGAGLGGAAGEAGAQALNRMAGYDAPAPMSTEALGQIAKAGALGAGTEGTGQIAASFAEKTLAPLGSKLLAKYSEQTRRLLDAAKTRGVHIDLDEAVKGLEPFERRAAAMGESAVAKLNAVKDSFLGNKIAVTNPATPGATKYVMPADDAHLARQGFDSAAKAVHEARRAKIFVGPEEKLQAQYSKALADGLRAQLKRDVPGYAEMMKLEETLLKRRETMQQAAKLAAAGAGIVGVEALPFVREMPWWGRVAMAYPAGRYAGRWLGSPGVSEAAVDALSSPAGKALLAGTVANVGRGIGTATR